MRPLRLLPPRLPHLRALGRRDGLAARTHLAHAQSRNRRSSARQHLPAAHRPLPRLHGLHDRLPVRRRVQQAHRRHTRPGRTPGRAHTLALALRSPLPQTPLRHLPASTSPAHPRRSTRNLPTRRAAETHPRQRPAEAPSRTPALDGSAAPAGAAQSVSLTSTHRQLRQQIPRPRRHAHRLRAGRLLRARQRRHRTGPRGRRL